LNMIPFLCLKEGEKNAGEGDYEVSRGESKLLQLFRRQEESL